MKCYLSDCGHPVSIVIRGMTCHSLVTMVAQNLNDDNLDVNNIKTKT